MEHPTQSEHQDVFDALEQAELSAFVATTLLALLADCQTYLDKNESLRLGLVEAAKSLEADLAELAEQVELHLS